MWIVLYFFVVFLLAGVAVGVVGCWFLGDGFICLVELVMFRVGGIDFSVIFLLDWMSLVFSSVVLIISGCVYIYMYDYMWGDDNIFRFSLLVFFFVGSMLVVIMSVSLIGILLGWDGLGLVSFCLVVYYQNYSSFNSGMITGISNRIGDAGLLVSIGMMFDWGSWGFFLIDGMSDGWLVVVMIVLAGFTSSAQVPFSAWLPAAMAAPTPVSALVHSSTLVTAGVYLLIRFYYLLGDYCWLMMFLAYSGVFTMFMAGLVANFETDMSSVIALSTLSQLGVMMISIGVGNVWLAFYHLIIHAVFKALLFLCGGSLIHGFGGCQDFRYMGGVVCGSPISVVSLNVANFSLCGLPFVSGYYSSDLILEMSVYYWLNVFMCILIVFGTMFTCMYSLSFSLGVGVSLYSGSDYDWNDYNFCCYLPMMVLSLGGVSLGLIFFWFGVSDVDEAIVFGIGKSWPIGVVLLGVIVGVMVFGVVLMDGVKMVGWLYGMFYLFWLSSMMNSFFLGLGLSVWGGYDSSWGEVVGGRGMSWVVFSLSGLVEVGLGAVYLVMIFSMVAWVLFFL